MEDYQHIVLIRCARNNFHMFSILYGRFLHYIEGLVYYSIQCQHGKVRKYKMIRNA